MSSKNDVNDFRREATSTILKLVTIDRFVGTDYVLDDLLRQLLVLPKRKQNEQPYSFLGKLEASTDRGKSTERRNITSFGIETIKACEALRLNAYYCPAGVPTIGYGHTKGVRIGSKISVAQAEAYLKDDLAVFCNAVNNYVKVPITQNQFDALVSFAFNVGTGNFKKSTLLKKLNNRDYFGAAREFDRWIYGGGKKLPGLVNRRKKEKRIFLSGM